ncbi:MAG: response regulator [Gammaproteobacteria bacterium]|nr:response regulator [Gammaproteobacteria bacterium]
MKPRLLLVDDNRTILFAMREYFAERGYRVSCACTKNEAETLLAEHAYTALITAGTDPLSGFR